MSRSVTWIFALALASCPALGVLTARHAAADPATVTAGAVRAVYARSGTPLRATAAPLARAVQRLPYGARVTILAIQGPWARVRTMSGQIAEGWLRTAQTVAPFAMSGEGRLGRSGVANELAQRPTGGLTSEEQDAVGRGLDKVQEELHKQQRQDLPGAYNAVDRLMATSPAPQRIESFAYEGGLPRNAPAAAR